ncbi:hypothetical protein DYST_01199 [Dyella terrae]|nr:hypothetical protein DYST_01199 [Dyella terrae]
MPIPPAGLIVHPSPPHRGPEGQKRKPTARAAELHIASRQVALLLLQGTKSRQKGKAKPFRGEFSTTVGKRSDLFTLLQW